MKSTSCSLTRRTATTTRFMALSIPAITLLTIKGASRHRAGPSALARCSTMGRPCTRRRSITMARRCGRQVRPRSRRRRRSATGIGPFRTVPDQRRPPLHPAAGRRRTNRSQPCRSRTGRSTTPSAAAAACASASTATASSSSSTGRSCSPHLAGTATASGCRGSGARTRARVSTSQRVLRVKHC